MVPVPQVSWLLPDLKPLIQFALEKSILTPNEMAQHIGRAQRELNLREQILQSEPHDEIGPISYKLFRLVNEEYATRFNSGQIKRSQLADYGRHLVKREYLDLILAFQEPKSLENPPFA